MLVKSYVLFTSCVAAANVPAHSKNKRRSHLVRDTSTRTKRSNQKGAAIDRAPTYSLFVELKVQVNLKSFYFAAFCLIKDSFRVPNPAL